MLVHLCWRGSFNEASMDARLTSLRDSVGRTVFLSFPTSISLAELPKVKVLMAALPLPCHYSAHVVLTAHMPWSISLSLSSSLGLSLFLFLRISTLNRKERLINKAKQQGV